MAKQGFTDPKLFDYSGDLKKEWYVGFRHTDPATGVRKPFQIRMGINYFPDLKSRFSEGKAVIGLVKNSLSQNWDPHTEELQAFIIRTLGIENQSPTKFFNDANAICIAIIIFQKINLEDW